MHPFLVVGNISIPMYFTMICIGIAIATIVCLHTATIYKLKKRHIAGAGIFAIIGLILGSKLFYAISLMPELIKAWEVVKATPGESLAYAFSGYVFYGGLLGILIALFIYSIQFHQHFYRLSNSFIPSIVLTHAFGRIGCFFAGCCNGLPYNGIISVTYTNGLNVPQIPIQLIESVIFMTLFILLNIMNKNKTKDITLLCIMSCAFVKFLLDFLRYEHINISITKNQIISLIFIIIVMIYMIYERLKKKS